jgi:hypothetical protein
MHFRCGGDVITFAGGGRTPITYFLSRIYIVSDANETENIDSLTPGVIYQRYKLHEFEELYYVYSRGVIGKDQIIIMIILIKIILPKVPEATCKVT